MISKISINNHKSLIKLCKSMSPEQRLLAFLNHSRLIAKIYFAGKRSRAKSRQSTHKKHRLAK